MKWRTVRKAPTLERAFEMLRNSDAHKGMGKIEITMEQQKELCEAARNQFFNASVRCEQMMAFCEWVVKERGGRIEAGKESDMVWEWGTKKT
jgi:hypothetical protein